MISRLLQTEALQKAFREAWRRKPCSFQAKWGIVVTFDEYTPGNALQINNGRKVLVVNMTFVEFGELAWSNEALWFTPAVLRHRVGMEMLGQYSRALTVIMQRMLAGPNGMFTTGLAMDLGFPHPVSLYAEVSPVLADGEGLEQWLQWRGASSIKPCPRHWNMVPCRTNLLEFDESRTYRDISCADTAQMRAYTCEDYKELARSLVAARAGARTKAELEKVLKASGFNCCKDGFLYAFAQGLVPGIKPSRAITVDFMHSFSARWRRDRRKCCLW